MAESLKLTRGLFATVRWKRGRVAIMEAHPGPSFVSASSRVGAKRSQVANLNPGDKSDCASWAHKAHDCAAEGHECPAPSYLVATQGIELYPAKN